MKYFIRYVLKSKVVSLVLMLVSAGIGRYCVNKLGGFSWWFVVLFICAYICEQSTYNLLD